MGPAPLDHQDVTRTLLDRQEEQTGGGQKRLVPSLDSPHAPSSSHLSTGQPRFGRVTGHPEVEGFSLPKVARPYSRNYVGNVSDIRPERNIPIQNGPFDRVSGH